MDNVKIKFLKDITIAFNGIDLINFKKGEAHEIVFNQGNKLLQDRIIENLNKNAKKHMFRYEVEWAYRYFLC